MYESVKLSGYCPNSVSIYRCTDTYQRYMMIGRAELQKVEIRDFVRICAFQAVDLSDVFDTCAHHCNARVSCIAMICCALNQWM